MTPKELQEQWLKSNKPSLSVQEENYLSKDGFNRSRKTYDELNQNKKVVVTNNQGKVSIHADKLDDEALQTLKNYKIDEDKYIGLYVSKIVNQARSYLKITATKDFINKGKIKTMYRLEDNTYINKKSLMKRQIFKGTTSSYNKKYIQFDRIEHDEVLK